MTHLLSFQLTFVLAMLNKESYMERVNHDTDVSKCIIMRESVDRLPAMKRR